MDCQTYINRVGWHTSESEHTKPISTSFMLQLYSSVKKMQGSGFAHYLYYTLFLPGLYTFCILCMYKCCRAIQSVNSTASPLCQTTLQLYIIAYAIDKINNIFSCMQIWTLLSSMAPLFRTKQLMPHLYIGMYHNKIL